MACTCVALVTSVTATQAVLPASCTRRAVSCSRVGLRAASVTRAPQRDKHTAIARPIPWLARAGSSPASVMGGAKGTGMIPLLMTRERCLDMLSQCPPFYRCTKRKGTGTGFTKWTSSFPAARSSGHSPSPSTRHARRTRPPPSGGLLVACKAAEMLPHSSCGRASG
jgi:hypothetical protein